MRYCPAGVDTNASPPKPTIGPMITIANHLRQNGHRVRMLTGLLYETQVAATGVEFLPLPAECDFDRGDQLVLLEGLDEVGHGARLARGSRRRR